MLSINNVELHHFYNEKTREALKLQASLFLKQYGCTTSTVEGDKYIDDIKNKLDKAFYSGNEEYVNSIIKKYNNKNHKDYLWISKMVNENTDEVNANNFDELIIKNITTNKQAKGMMFLLLDNVLNSKEEKNCAVIYKALHSFDENNILKSQVKLSKALTVARSNKQNNTNAIDKIINDAKINYNGGSKLETYKTIASNTFEFITKKITDGFDKLIPFYAKEFIHNVKLVIEFIKSVGSLFLELGKYAYKEVKQDVQTLNELVNETKEKEAMLRRLNKRKNKCMPKLKPDVVKPLRPSFAN